jgi:hypothetical protein
MRKRKPVINYMHVSHNFLVELGLFIVSCMTTNLNFPTPSPTILILDGLVTDFQNKVTLAGTGDSNAQAEMMAARELLLAALRKIGLYVDLTADGDEVKLRSSGFMLSHDPVPSQHETFYLLHGKNPGEIYIVQNAIDKAVSYVFMYYDADTPPDDETLWKFGRVKSMHRATLTDMPRMKKVWIRGCAVLRKDQMTAWNQPQYIVLG